MKVFRTMTTLRLEFYFKWTDHQHSSSRQPETTLIKLKRSEQISFRLQNK